MYVGRVWSQASCDGLVHPSATISNKDVSGWFLRGKTPGQPETSTPFLCKAVLVVRYVLCCVVPTTNEMAKIWKRPSV